MANKITISRKGLTTDIEKMLGLVEELEAELCAMQRHVGNNDVAAVENGFRGLHALEKRVETEIGEPKVFVSAMEAFSEKTDTLILWEEDAPPYEAQILEPLVKRIDNIRLGDVGELKECFKLLKHHIETHEDKKDYVPDYLDKAISRLVRQMDKRRLGDYQYMALVGYFYKHGSCIIEGAVRGDALKENFSRALAILEDPEDTAFAKTHADWVVTYAIHRSVNSELSQEEYEAARLAQREWDKHLKGVLSDAQSLEDGLTVRIDVY